MALLPLIIICFGYFVIHINCTVTKVITKLTLMGQFSDLVVALFLSSSLSSLGRAVAMSWIYEGSPVGGDEEYLWVTSDGFPGPNVTEEDVRCNAVFTYDYHLAVAISCVMLLLFGIVYSLFGEKSRKLAC